MIEKVVEFGTRVGGRVLTSSHGMIFVKGDDGEGYILVGNKERPEVGDVGTLEFKPGGPKGGYWEFQVESKKADSDQEVVR